MIGRHRAVGWSGRMAIAGSLMILAGRFVMGEGFAQGPQPLPAAESGVVGGAIGDTPQARFRSIDEPSAVDRFRSEEANRRGETLRGGVAPAAYGQAFGGDSVRQAVRMQGASDASPMGMPTLPPGGYASPPSLSEPMSLPPTYSPSTGLPNPTVVAPALPPPNFGAAPPPNYGSPSAGTTVLPPPNVALPNTSSPGRSAPINQGIPINQAAPIVTTPGAGTRQVLPPTQQVMPPARAVQGPVTVPIGGDYAPLPQPQLTTGYATLGNCRNVSGPSGYNADRIPTYAPSAGCVTPAAATAPYLAPTGPVGAAPVGAAPVPMTTVLPPVATTPVAGGYPQTPLGTYPNAAIPGATYPGAIGVAPYGVTPAAPATTPYGGMTVIPGQSKYHPLVSMGQQQHPVQVGQGILGQPKAYVPGQGVRNFIRYLTP